MNLANIKKYIIPALLVICLLLVGVYSFDTGSRLAKLKGEYATLKDLRAADLKSWQGDIAKYAEEIRLMDTAIAKANKRIADLMGQGATSAGTIAELEKQYADLLQNGGDKDKLIENLQSQVASWKVSFSLLEKVVAEKDAVIFSLTAKYETALKLGQGWQTQYIDEHALRLKSEKLLTAAEWQIRRWKLQSTVELVAAAVVGGYYLYAQLKGK